MKKLILVPALLFAGNLMAKEYKYEITPVIGYNIAEGNLNLENQFLVGAEFQLNTDTFLKPELSILFSDTDYEDLTPTNPSTDIWRFGLNGVHDFDAIGVFTPLMKVGVGYESIDKNLADNDNALFVSAGAGVKAAITDAIALKLEAVYMNKEFDSNFAVLAGLNYAFGEKAQKSAPVSTPTPKSTPKPTPTPAPIDGDDDRDGVLNSKDKCPNTPAGEAVNSDGCPIPPAVVKPAAPFDGDYDNDGVLDSMDKCPTTPIGNVVDSDGCTLKVNLHIKFENNSYNVDLESQQRVAEFANFLKERLNYSAQIIGHTNSIGSDKSNLRLSKNRANAVKELLIAYGIDASRISTVGKGESEPMMSNDTQEGLEANRRIEATLTQH
jgi:OOP family OmpA-OmpF porin